MADVVNPQKSPMALIKKFLSDNKIAYKDNDTPAALRIKVQRRLIRKKFHGLGVNGPVHGVTTAMSLGQLKVMVQNISANNYGPKAFICFNAKLNFVEPLVTITRCSSTCRGVVKNGSCTVKSCTAVPENEENFCINMILSDLENQHDMFNLIGYQATGKIMFGADATAADVAKWDDDKLGDVLEQWSEVPINVHAIIEYDIKKGAVRLSPYDITRLPIDYLPEYS